ncbi:MAG: glycosyltransferase [Mailhella sp.]|nr:glycosyltransferase [Mailhella sp.]
MKKPILSIIMPCYNVEKTIARALDSILFQQVDFLYEVLCVNDASTDNSVEKIKEYSQKYDFIKLLENPCNVGNAETFYNGLKAARGKYFIVLDGDDFYSLRTKLQQQVDFFEQDIKEEYCAVTHYHILYKDDGTVNIPNFDISIKEYSYQNFLERQYQYHHTSAYMFRNIYNGNPPDVFKKDSMRGDHPRVFLELILSNKKIKVMPFFGSVYNYNFQGIWSSLDFEKKIARNVTFSKAIKGLATNAYEKSCMDRWSSNYENALTNLPKDYDPTPKSVSKESILSDIAKRCDRLAFGNEGFAFHSLYKSSLYDSLCATLGYIKMLELGLDVLAYPAMDSETIMIVVRGISPRGGGIFSEICELSSQFHDKKVVVLCTEDQQPSPEGVAILSRHSAEILCIPQGCEDRLDYVFRKVAELKPERMYFYVGHNNPLIDCLVQPALSCNIHVFSYDHGFVLGLENPNFHSFLVKRPVDYALLKKNGIKQVDFIPVWSAPAQHELRYEPFRNSARITTATAAARWYKCDGNWPCNYLELVFESLQKTKGRHIHYGKMPDEALTRVKEFLAQSGLPEDSFINIPWAEDLGRSLLENGVDIFIEPFPVVSAKISLIVQSAGVPIIRHDGMTRLSIADFVYEEAFLWRTKADFFDVILSLDAYTLRHHSKLAHKDFEERHSLEAVCPYIRENISFPLRNCPDFYDDVIQEYHLKTVLHRNDTKTQVDTIKIKKYLIKLELMRISICSIFKKKKYKDKKSKLKMILKNQGSVFFNSVNKGQA